ncbi:MAG: GTPase HflX [Clostridia bacterium]|nr:GTPase HflX [Clostridia bacterium]
MEQSVFKNVLEEEGRLPSAVLVSVFRKGEDPSPFEASLAELERLLETAGGEVFAKLVQVKEHPENATYIGSGKIKELASLCETGGVSLVVCDEELSPMQIKNLEDALGGDIRVIDRTMLILDIFALHATTADGKLQVELAQLKYSAPRLYGKGKDLSRLGGGIGTRGPGETKLESDKRHLKERIRALEDQLEVLSKNRELQRKQREKAGIFRIAIAGYTNAGKSTLLNALTGAGVKEKDELFATLDPTTRRYALPSGNEILLTDTVGFIRNLPHHLVKAFRSTLEEVALCDGVLVVVDSSDPESDAQLKVTVDLLTELGASSKPTLYVLNKSDKAFSTIIPFMGKEGAGKIVQISALTGQGIPLLLEKIEEMVSGGKKTVKALLPSSAMGLLARLYEEANVKSVDYTPEGAEVVAVVDDRLYGKLKPYIKE